MIEGYDTKFLDEMDREDLLHAAKRFLVVLRNYQQDDPIYSVLFDENKDILVVVPDTLCLLHLHELGTVVSTRPINAAATVYFDKTKK